MRSIGLLLIFLSYLYSQININTDLVELYRQQGINNIEKLLSKQLHSYQYWQRALSTEDLSKGYYESIQYLIICNKNTKQLKLYDTANKKILFASKVFIGKKNGDKAKEGDLRTPTGVYEFEQKITKLDPFYGPLALATTYPNLYDQNIGKTGHGIWIHGLPINQKRDDYTKGCIALPNKTIIELDKAIKLDKTALIITPTTLQDVSLDDISFVLADIYKWKDAWKYNDFKQYISFYDPNFKKNKYQDLNYFIQYKQKLFTKNEQKQIRFTNINIIPYPNQKNQKMFKIIMDEFYQTKNYRFVGKKELYVRLVNKHMLIVAEN